MTELEQLSQDIGIDPRVLQADFGARELAAVARINTMLNATETMKPQQFKPLTSRKGGEFGEVGTSIPEDLFYRLLNLGPKYGLMEMIRSRDLRQLKREHPVCRTETVSGKVMSGYGSKPCPKAKPAGVRFDSSVNVSFAQ